jgi:hypothetical protein
MERLSELDDAELVELELRLAEDQGKEPPGPLRAGEDVPDESVEALTTLVQVTKERKARMIPDITRSGLVYEVRYEQQTSDSAAEFVTEPFPINPEDPEAARQKAIARAVQVAEILRRAQT